MMTEFLDTYIFRLKLVWYISPSELSSTKGGNKVEIPLYKYNASEIIHISITT